PNAAGTITQTDIEKTDETTNFEISKVVENHVQDIGTINRISVAVLVNGRYEPGTAEGETETMTYTPRSQEELERIERLVKSAIGFDQARGDMVEVVSMEFDGSTEALQEDGALDWLKQDFHNILQTAILGIVAILAILLV